MEREPGLHCMGGATPRVDRPRPADDSIDFPQARAFGAQVARRREEAMFNAIAGNDHNSTTTTDAKSIREAMRWVFLDPTIEVEPPPFAEKDFKAWSRQLFSEVCRKMNIPRALIHRADA